MLEVCEDRGIAGVIAVNTTTDRPNLASADGSVGSERGGLSGAPLLGRALQVVRFVAGRTRLPVIGVGGISTPDDGLAMLDAGASLIQLYTGLIYRGPGLVRDLNRALAGASIGRTHEVIDRAGEVTTHSSHTSPSGSGRLEG